MPLKRFIRKVHQETTSEEDDGILPDLIPPKKKQRVTHKEKSGMESSPKRKRLTRQELRARLKKGPGATEEVICIADDSDSEATIITSYNDITSDNNIGKLSTPSLQNGADRNTKNTIESAKIHSNTNESSRRPKGPNLTKQNKAEHQADISSDDISYKQEHAPKTRQKRSNVKVKSVVNTSCSNSEEKSSNDRSKNKFCKRQVRTAMNSSNTSEDIQPKAFSRVTRSKTQSQLNTQNIISTEHMIKVTRTTDSRERRGTAKFPSCDINSSVSNLNSPTINNSVKSSKRNNSEKPSTTRNSAKPSTSETCEKTENQSILSVLPTTSSSKTCSNNVTGQDIEVIDLCDLEDEPQEKGEQSVSQSDLPIIYENGIPDRINPDVNTDRLDPRFKRLLDQKRPVMKKVQELKDLSHCHYIMTDLDGNISKDNDSVAQFIIDIGILVKQAGKDLIEDGKRLQLEISNMRQDEQLQLKQEIESDEKNNSQEVQNATENIKADIKSIKKSPAMISKYKAGRQRKQRPQTAEEKLKRSHVCQICGDSFIEKEHLQTHLNKHAACLIRCTDCGRTFYSAERHRKHKLGHINGFKNCHYCSLSFDTLKGLRDHVKRHERLKWMCDIEGCQKKFADKWNYINHIQYGHTDQRSVPCDLCNKFFKSPNVVRSHKYRDHV